MNWIPLLVCVYSCLHLHKLFYFGSKMYSVVKYAFYFILSIIFLSLIIKSYNLLKSEKSGITLKHLKQPTEFPSFTICPYPYIQKGLKITSDQVLAELNIQNLTNGYMKVDVSYNGIM